MKIIKTSILALLIGVVCLVIYMNCSPTVGPTEVVDGYIRDGWKLFERKRYDEAANKFNQAITDAPKDERGYHGAGWCKLLQNQSRQAIDFFNQAIVNGNSSLDPIAGLEFAHLANQN